MYPRREKAPKLWQVRGDLSGNPRQSPRKSSHSPHYAEHLIAEHDPENPYLLRAEFEPFGDTYVIKPTLSREGANVTIIESGHCIAETMGNYTESPKIYQAYHPLPDFEGKSTVIGSWIVNGYASGIGLREDDGPITRNTSRFIPHLFRKSSYIEPPGID